LGCYRIIPLDWYSCRSFGKALNWMLRQATDISLNRRPNRNFAVPWVLIRLHIIPNKCYKRYTIYNIKIRFMSHILKLVF